MEILVIFFCDLGIFTKNLKGMSTNRPINADSDLNAEDWKARGSKYFYIKKFAEAIKCYSKALVGNSWKVKVRFNDFFILATSSERLSLDV